MSCSEDFFDGYGNRSRKGRWPPWPMSQSWLGAGPRIGLGAPDSESGVFFQCHTASEPIPGTLFCARFLSLPQSHPWSLQDMGTNHSFPARVPLSLLSSRSAFASLSCSPHLERSCPASVAWVRLSSGPSPFSQVLHWDGADGWILSGTSCVRFHCLPSEAFPSCFSSGPLSLGALGIVDPTGDEEQSVWGQGDTCLLLCS